MASRSGKGPSLGKAGRAKNTVGLGLPRQGGSRQAGVPSGPYANAGIKGTQGAINMGGGRRGKRASNNV